MLVDSNSWAEFSAAYRRTRQAHLEHEGAKAELKTLVPEDARLRRHAGTNGFVLQKGRLAFRASEWLLMTGWSFGPPRELFG
jgi:hypothetical protein